MAADIPATECEHEAAKMVVERYGGKCFCYVCGELVR